MNYKLDKAYDVHFGKVNYVVEVPSFSMDYNKTDIVTVQKVLVNRSLSFFYYTKTIHKEIIYNVFNTINKYEMVVAGQTIKAKNACITNISYDRCNTLLDGKTKPLWKVSVVLEIMCEKSLEVDKVPLKSFLFTNPVTNFPCRVQFCATPSTYSDKEVYPNMFHAGNGYGFYTENRPDLNVQEPVFVTRNGQIVQKIEDVVYHEITVRKEAEWRNLNLPAEIGDLS